MNEVIDELRELCDRHECDDVPDVWNKTVVFREARATRVLDLSQSVDVKVNTDAVSRLILSPEVNGEVIISLAWNEEEFSDWSSTCDVMVTDNDSSVLPAMVSTLCKNNYKVLQQFVQMMYRDWKSKVTSFRGWPMCFEIIHRDHEAYELLKENTDLLEQNFVNLVSFHMYLNAKLSFTLNGYGIAGGCLLDSEYDSDISSQESIRETPRIEDIDHSIGDIDHSIEDMDHRIGDMYHRIGDMDHRIGDMESMSAQSEREEPSTPKELICVHLKKFENALKIRGTDLDNRLKEQRRQTEAMNSLLCNLVQCVNGNLSVDSLSTAEVLTEDHAREHCAVAGTITETPTGGESREHPEKKSQNHEGPRRTTHRRQRTVGEPGYSSKDPAAGSQIMEELAVAANLSSRPEKQTVHIEGSAAGHFPVKTRHSTIQKVTQGRESAALPSTVDRNANEHAPIVRERSEGAAAGVQSSPPNQRSRFDSAPVAVVSPVVSSSIQKQPTSSRQSNPGLNSDVENQRWSHGIITRDEIERILQPVEEGKFLIRESMRHERNYVICVCHQNKVVYYLILQHRDRFSIDQKRYFRNLTDLIKHYNKTNGLLTKLTKPVLPTDPISLGSLSDLLTVESPDPVPVGSLSEAPRSSQQAESQSDVQEQSTQSRVKEQATSQTSRVEIASNRSRTQDEASQQSGIIMDINNINMTPGVSLHRNLEEHGFLSSSFDPSAIQELGIGRSSIRIKGDGPVAEILNRAVDRASQTFGSFPSKANALDTVLCLDVSSSIGQKGLQEMKKTALDFINGIEEIAANHDVEENIGLVTFGGSANLIHHLSNDYGSVRSSIENLTIGGSSPLIEAVLVSQCCIEQRGGTLTLAGVRTVRARLIILTDGIPSDVTADKDVDVIHCEAEVKAQVVGLLQNLRSASGFPKPVVLVPVGNADTDFLQFLSASCEGCYVEANDVQRLCRYQRKQIAIAKVFVLNKRSQEEYESDPRVMTEIIASDMESDDKDEIVCGVLEMKDGKHQFDPSVIEAFNEMPDLPPLGSRVIRGPHWRHNNQDTEGPGTVVGHRQDLKDYIMVHWDNDEGFTYKYGADGEYEVCVVEDQPRYKTSEFMLDVGCEVTRGPDWEPRYANQDGGSGGVGVVIHSTEEGSVKVRWRRNGHINTYRYGKNGKLDLILRDPVETLKEATSSGAMAAKSSTVSGPVSTKGPTVSGPGTAKSSPGPVTAAIPQESTVPTDGSMQSAGGEEEEEHFWEWFDSGENMWHPYSPEMNDKLEKSYRRRSGGSCLIQRNGESYRVLFRENQEKTLDGESRRRVRRMRRR